MIAKFLILRPQANREQHVTHVFAKLFTKDTPSVWVNNVMYISIPKGLIVENEDC